MTGPRRRLPTFCSADLGTAPSESVVAHDDGIGFGFHPAPRTNLFHKMSSASNLFMTPSQVSRRGTGCLSTFPRASRSESLAVVAAPPDDDTSEDLPGCDDIRAFSDRGATPHDVDGTVGASRQAGRPPVRVVVRVRRVRLAAAGHEREAVTDLVWTRWALVKQSRVLHSDCALPGPPAKAVTPQISPRDAEETPPAQAAVETANTPIARR
jgi:hypothetical protein